MYFVNEDRFRNIAVTFDEITYFVLLVDVLSLLKGNALFTRRQFIIKIQARKTKQLVGIQPKSTCEHEIMIPNIARLCVT